MQMKFAHTKTIAQRKHVLMDIYFAELKDLQIFDIRLYKKKKKLFFFKILLKRFVIFLQIFHT